MGLDLGTTNVKAVVVDRAGAIVARGAVPVAMRHTPAGGIEQDIEEIWRATLSAIQAAGRQSDLAAVRAVGVSSQGGAMQIQTRDGRCLGPVISWLDPRGRTDDEAILRKKGESWLVRCIGHGQGNIALGQILRLGRSHPELLAWPNVVGFVGDTIVRRLCGRAACDCSSLSISCLYSPLLRGVDPDLLAELGLRAEQLPDLCPARSAAGALRSATARQTGLTAGIPVSPAVHDQYAAALGCGALEPGDVMFGAGTAWVLVAVADHLMTPVAPSAWVCDHVVPGRWGQLFSLAVGGSAVQWVLDMIGQGEAARERIDELIDVVPPGSDGLSIWPFLDATGGRNRPVGGRIYGLRLAHGPAHLLRATVEGLCFELARQLGWLIENDCPVHRLIMCGGGSRSRCTPQIVADVTGRAVLCPQETEISACGAAVLARGIVEPETPLPALYRSMAGPSRELAPGNVAEVYRRHLREYILAVDNAVKI